MRQLQQKRWHYGEQQLIPSLFRLKDFLGHKKPQTRSGRKAFFTEGSPNGL